MPQDPLKKLGFAITDYTIAKAEGRTAGDLKASITLRNGISLPCTFQGVQSRKLSKQKAPIWFSTIRHLMEKWTYHHVVHEGREFLISKKALNETITNLLFGEREAPEDMRKKVRGLYKHFEKNASHLLTIIGTLNKETYSKQTFGKGKTFHLVRTDDSTFDVRLRVKKVGAGSFKKVYETYSIVDGVRRALAMPRKRTVQNKEDLAAAIAAIDHEVAIAKKLKGVDYVAQPTKLTSPSGQSRVMYSEFCDRVDLFTLLDEGNMRPADLQRILLLTAEGVWGMHERGICHLDLKPENIGITTEQGQTEPRIFDFGISARRGDKIKPSGTPRFMAPEVATAGKAREDITASPAMDVFSYGCLLYDCLSTENPLFVSTEDHYLPQGNQQHCEGKEKELRETGNPFSILIADCIQYDPGKRPTMEQIVRRLQEIDTQYFCPPPDIQE